MGLWYDYNMKTHSKSFSQLALIGSTASGKTALSIELAQKTNAYILSLDSLAIYKKIDIVSAKPTPEERQGIRHFGIDIIYPDENFDVNTYISLYHKVRQQCKEDGKNLIIVGGTSFYLKILIEGISIMPKISDSTKKEASTHLKSLNKTYQWLDKLDHTYMAHIASADRYRIEKALSIYLETGLTPTEYFTLHPPQPVIKEPLPLYQITWEREILKERIALRTQLMLNDGLIDEVCMLEKKYSRAPNSMKSIGIKETLAYLDGCYDKEMLTQKITTNTARLAKRQNTFNNSQFNNVVKGSVEVLKKKMLLSMNYGIQG